ncbi:MAG: EAL domain-containing protein [Proteobacteria bacterium]|nr:EAL domain-containing protein [Pseudomonadota bacterium]
MSTQVIYHANPPGVPGFLMARQPVLDRHQDPVAFDLLFCDADGASAVGAPAAPISVLGYFGELNMEKTVGELRGFVDVDEAVLMSDVFNIIPRTKFILNLTENVRASESLLQRVAQLAHHGFVFALDEVLSDAADIQKFLPLVDIVKFDLHQLPLDALIKLTPQKEFASKRLMVENVDTLAQFDTCLALGFDYFQGYYFAHPIILPDRQLAPSQLAAIEVVTLISTEADSGEIEERIKRDVSLGLNLLRLVNTAAVGSHRIDSLRQALMVLGRNQLLSWMQVMLYAQPRENVASVKPLLMQATTRGKMLELLAQRHRPGNRSIADAAFTVGIMSLMDALFGMPMAQIVRQIAVVEEISDALLQRKGYYGELLKLTELSERAETLSLVRAELDKLQISSGEFYQLQSEAFEWSNLITQGMH